MKVWPAMVMLPVRKLVSVLAVAAGANLLKFSRSEIAGNYVSAQWDAETVLG